MNQTTLEILPFCVSVFPGLQWYRYDVPSKKFLLEGWSSDSDFQLKLKVVQSNLQIAVLLTINGQIAITTFRDASTEQNIDTAVREAILEAKESTKSLIQVLSKAAS